MEGRKPRRFGRGEKREEHKNCRREKESDGEVD